MHSNDSNSLSLNILNYSGSLDALLELAKSQKVDLNQISVTELADQFHNFLTKSAKLNLNLASEYLLMATWLTYLKSKLLLPETEEEEFKALEVADKLKLQLKKLELIRLLSDQMQKRKRIGKDIFFRGSKGNIRSIYSTKYSATLYEILKSYSSIVMKRDFQKINIPKLPIFSTEEGIKRIRSLFNSLTDWKDINKLIPNKFLSSKKSKKAGISGIFSAALELVKEGDLIIKQSKLFDKIYIKQKI